MTFQASYYEILDLPSVLQDDPLITAQILRRAYKRALLQNHPDKVTAGQNKTYSIDQIANAFTVLSDPRARQKYDAEMKLQGVGKGYREDTQKAAYKTGMETVDLDDLQISSRGNEEIWYRDCRCGDERGFEVTESELADAADAGERGAIVGCRGCSLWLRVTFGVLEEADEEEEGVSHSHQKELLAKEKASK